MRDVFSNMARLYGETVPITCGDTSQALTDLFDAAYSGTIKWDKVRAALIACENNDARISFGVAAANGGSPVGYIFESLEKSRLPSNDFVVGAYVINKTAGSSALLMVTLEYEP